jgi:hypothetical protein
MVQTKVADHVAKLAVQQRFALIVQVHPQDVRYEIMNRPLEQLEGHQSLGSVLTRHTFLAQ